MSIFKTNTLACREFVLVLIFFYFVVPLFFSIFGAYSILLSIFGKNQVFAKPITFEIFWINKN